SFVKPAPVRQTTDDAATQQWLTQEVARQRGDVSPQPAPADAAPAALQHQSPANQSPPPVVQPQPPPQPAQSQTNEEATRAWLDRTIEERRNANPPVPMQQAPVEHTGYVDRPYPEGDASYGYSYDRGGQLVYGPYSSPGYGYGGNPSFPIHTAL